MNYFLNYLEKKTESNVEIKMIVYNTLQTVGPHRVLSLSLRMQMDKLNENQCAFFLTKKKRYCRFKSTANGKYCPEHAGILGVSFKICFREITLK